MNFVSLCLFISNQNIKYIFSILARGCLYNVRRDPSESHDLWNKANKIAVLLTSRLRSLWAMQKRKSPPNLQIQGDPVNFDFVWTPWIFSESENDIINGQVTSRQFSGLQNGRNITVAGLINCDRESGFSNLLCLLRSVF